MSGMQCTLFQAREHTLATHDCPIPGLIGVLVPYLWYASMYMYCAYLLTGQRTIHFSNKDIIH